MVNHPNRNLNTAPADADVPTCRVTYTTKTGTEMSRSVASVSAGSAEADKLRRKAGYRNIKIWNAAGEMVRNVG